MPEFLLLRLARRPCRAGRSGISMKTYEVRRISDGTVMTRYDAPDRVEWQGYEFANFDHVDVTPTTTQTTVLRVTVYGGRRKLTKLEFRALLTPAEQQAIDKFEAHYESMAFPPAVMDRIRTSVVKRGEATVMDLDDPDLTAGLGLHVALGNLAYSRISEIVNG